MTEERQTEIGSGRRTETEIRRKENTENQVQTGKTDTQYVVCMLWICIYVGAWIIVPFREKPPPAKESRPSPPAPSWLQRDLHVRFIDKAFKGGKYYNSKVLHYHREAGLVNTVLVFHAERCWSVAKCNFFICVFRWESRTSWRPTPVCVVQRRADCWTVRNTLSLTNIRCILTMRVLLLKLVVSFHSFVCFRYKTEDARDHCTQERLGIHYGGSGRTPRTGTWIHLCSRHGSVPNSHVDLLRQHHRHTPDIKLLHWKMLNTQCY